MSTNSYSKIEDESSFPIIKETVESLPELLNESVLHVYSEFITVERKEFLSNLSFTELQEGDAYETEHGVYYPSHFFEGEIEILVESQYDVSNTELDKTIIKVKFGLFPKYASVTFTVWPDGSREVTTVVYQLS